MSNEKSNTIHMQLFGGKIYVLWDLCKHRIVNSEQIRKER